MRACVQCTLFTPPTACHPSSATPSASGRFDRGPDARSVGSSACTCVRAVVCNTTNNNMPHKQACLGTQTRTAGSPRGPAAGAAAAMTAGAAAAWQLCLQACRGPPLLLHTLLDATAWIDAVAARAKHTIPRPFHDSSPDCSGGAIIEIHSSIQHNRLRVGCSMHVCEN